MTPRIVASFVVILLPLWMGTPRTRAQAMDEDPVPGGGRWSVGLYSTRDYLERNGPHVLLDLAVVRDELRVTKAQLSEMSALQADVGKVDDEDIQITSDDVAGRDPRAVMVAKVLERYDRKQKMMDDGTSRILNAIQRRRLREISLQLEGILAVVRPEIQESLNMSESQVLNIKDIKKKYEQSKIMIFKKKTAIVKQQSLPSSKAEAARLATSKDRVEARRKAYDERQAEFDAMRERAEALIKRWLTRRQEEKFKKLCGKPFAEIEKMRIPGFDWKQEELRRQRKQPAKGGADSSKREPSKTLSGRR